MSGKTSSIYDTDKKIQMREKINDARGAKIDALESVIKVMNNSIEAKDIRLKALEKLVHKLQNNHIEHLQADVSSLYKAVKKLEGVLETTTLDS